MAKRSHQPGVADGTEVTPSTPTKTSKAKTATSKSGRKGKSSGAIVRAPIDYVIGAAATPKKSTPKSKERKLVGKVQQNKIIVAFDFGTTYSAVAVVMSLQDARDMQVIFNWAGGVRNNEQMEKVPTRIAFAKENQNMIEDQWGYDVPPGAKSYSWFKLLLDRSAPMTKYDSEQLTGKLKVGLLELPEDMEINELVTAYLSKLYEHIMATLERNHTASILKVTPIEFWFTMPATWQESAIADTLDAAKEAGFGTRAGDKVSTVSEPEAAAIAIISQVLEKKPNLVKVQNDVLVCDLGGGTLDFQLLTVTNLSPLQLEHTVTGIGGKSGSAYIDCNFHAWLEDTFGNAFRRLPTTKTGTGSKFMNDWEVVKKSFNGKDLNKKHQIPLPALGQALRDRSLAATSYDFEDHSVLVAGVDIAKMFEPVFENAFKLINQQLEAVKKEGRPPFSVMCLCGGLGNSDYVWAKFQEFNNEMFAGQCELLTDERAWSAVVRGAAIRGLEGNKVLSRKAKRCYGIGCHRKFRDGVDKLEDRFWCETKKHYRAEGYICWPILVGKSFTENMRVESPFYMPRDDDVDEYTWTIFSCPSEEPPERADDPDGKKKGLQFEGEILIHVSPSDRTRKRQKKDNGSHEDADSESGKGEKVNLVIKMGDERGTLVFEVLSNRRVVGSTLIDYSRTHARRAVSRSAGLF